MHYSMYMQYTFLVEKKIWTDGEQIAWYILLSGPGSSPSTMIALRIRSGLSSINGRTIIRFIID
jgi:hypothetical protein